MMSKKQKILLSSDSDVETAKTIGVATMEPASFKLPTVNIGVRLKRRGHAANALVEVLSFATV